MWDITVKTNIFACAGLKYWLHVETLRMRRIHIHLNSAAWYNTFSPTVKGIKRQIAKISEVEIEHSSGSGWTAGM